MSIPLPNDELGRYWAELSGHNPHEVDKLRPTLVTFLAFDRYRNVTQQTTVGTGFVIGRLTNGFAVVLTAKHVFDGIQRVQSPDVTHARTSLFVPEGRNLPSPEPGKLKVLWGGSSEHAAMLDVGWIHYADPMDLAICIVKTQPELPHVFEPACIPLDLSTPKIGELVHMISIGAQEAEELAPPRGEGGFGQHLLLQRTVSIRMGTVTGVYPTGYNQYRFPCFTPTIVAEPGMSGGFVYTPRDKQTIAACGVVSAELSGLSGVTNQRTCGESLISSTWPTLALKLPLEAHDKAPQQTILQFIKAGNFLDPVPAGAASHFSMSEDGTQLIVSPTSKS